MLITFILSSLKLSGGNRVVIEYANCMIARGHQVRLLVPGNSTDADMAQLLDHEVQITETRYPLDKATGLIGQARLALEMAKRVPVSDVILSTHTPTTLVNWIASRFLHRGPGVWLCQDYPEMFARRPFNAWLFQHALGWHRGGLAISQYSREIVQRFAPQSEIIIVGEGLSLYKTVKDLAIHRRHRDPNDPLVLFYIGDMRPRKGLREFLLAADLVYEKQPSLLLWVASKEKCTFESRVPYHFYERPTDAELVRLYTDCDAFVSTSWFEGFGLPPLEAMACGAPVVMTDSLGVREYAKNRENCLLVPPRDPQALAGAILEIFSDQSLAEQLRRNGPSTAEAYTWDSAAELFEAGLMKLLRPDRG